MADIQIKLGIKFLDSDIETSAITKQVQQAINTAIAKTDLSQLKSKIASLNKGAAGGKKSAIGAIKSETKALSDQERVTRRTTQAMREYDAAKASAGTKKPFNKNDIQILSAADQKTRELAKSFQNAGVSATLFGTRIAEIGKRFSGFFVWTTLLFKFMEAVRFTAQAIKELDSTAVSLAKVLGGETTQSINALTHSLLSLATDTRRTFTEVSDAMKGFVRTGLTASEALKATKAAMDLLNVSTVDATTAQKLLTTTVNSMNITWDEAGQKVAVFSDLADRNAVVVKDLAQGFIRAGATASAFGITTEELGAMIATVAGKTQLAANRIGTAFKTLFVNTAKNRGQILSLTAAYSGNASSIIKLDSEYNTVAKTLQFVSKNWAALSAAQRTALGRLVGGARRFTEFAALMEGSAKYQSNLTVAMEKSNSVQRKSQVEAKSLEAAHRALQTSIAKLAKVLEGIGATTFYKTLINTLSQGIGLITDMINGTEQWSKSLEGWAGFFKDGLSSLNLIKNAVIVLFAKVFIPFIKKASVGFINFITANQRGIEKLIGIEKNRQAQERLITQEYQNQNITLAEQNKLLKATTAAQKQKISAMAGGMRGQTTNVKQQVVVLKNLRSADQTAKGFKATLSKLNNSTAAQVGATIFAMQALSNLAGGLDRLATASDKAGNQITSNFARAGASAVQGAATFAAFGVQGLAAGAIMGSFASIMKSVNDALEANRRLEDETRKANEAYISSTELVLRAQTDYALAMELLKNDIGKLEKGEIVLDLSKLPTIVNFKTYQEKATGLIKKDLDEITRNAEIFKVEMAEARQRIDDSAKSAGVLRNFMSDMAATKVEINARGAEAALPALNAVQKVLARIEAQDIGVAFGKGIQATEGMIKPIEHLRQIMGDVERGIIDSSEGMAQFNDNLDVRSPELDALRARFAHLNDRINAINEDFNIMQQNLEHPTDISIDFGDAQKNIEEFKNAFSELIKAQEKVTVDSAAGASTMTSISASVQLQAKYEKERADALQKAKEALGKVTEAYGAQNVNLEKEIQLLTSIDKISEKELTTRTLLDNLGKSALKDRLALIKTTQDGLGLSEERLKLEQQIEEVTKKTKGHIVEQALSLIKEVGVLELITANQRTALSSLQQQTQVLQQAQTEWQQIAISAALQGKSVDQSVAAMQKYGQQLRENIKSAQELKNARAEEIAALKARKDLSATDIDKAVKYVEVEFDLRIEKVAQKRIEILGNVIKAQIDKVRGAAQSLKKSLDTIASLRGDVLGVDKEIAQLKGQLRDIRTQERNVTTTAKRDTSADRDLEVTSNIFVEKMKEVAKALQNGHEEASRYVLGAQRELGLTKKLINVFGEVAIASDTAANVLLSSENSILHIRTESAQASLDIFKSEYEKLKGFGESLYTAGPAQIRKLAQANALLQNSTLSMSDTLAQMPTYLRDAASQILKLRFGERGENLIAEAGLARAGIPTDALDELRNKTVNAIYTVAQEQIRPLEEQVIEQKKTNEIMEKYLGKSFVQQEAFTTVSASSNEKLNEINQGQIANKEVVRQQLRDAIERKKLLQSQIVQETNSAQTQERIILSLNPGMRTLTNIMPQQLSATYQMVEGIKLNTASMADLSATLKTKTENGAEAVVADGIAATIDTSQITTSLNELTSTVINNTSAITDSSVATHALSTQVTDLYAAYISHTPILNKIANDTAATKAAIDTMRSGATLSTIATSLNNVVAAIKALDIRIDVTVKNVVNKYSSVANRAAGLNTPEIGSLVAAAKREKAKMPIGADLIMANSSELVMTPKQAAKIFGQVNIPDRHYVSSAPQVKVDGIDNVGGLMKKLDILFAQQKELMDMAGNKKLFTAEQNIKIDVGGKREVLIKGIAEMGQELERVFKKNMAKVSTRAEHMALKSTLNHLIRRLREMGIDGV